MKALATAVGIVLLTTGLASACSCTFPSPADPLMAVFEGRVVHRQTYVFGVPIPSVLTPVTAPFGSDATVVVQVDRMLKGKSREFVVLRSGWNSFVTSHCGGAPPPPGSRLFTMYLDRNGTGYFNGCSITAKGPLEALVRRVPPVTAALLEKSPYYVSKAEAYAILGAVADDTAMDADVLHPPADATRLLEMDRLLSAAGDVRRRWMLWANVTRDHPDLVPPGKTESVERQVWARYGRSTSGDLGKRPALNPRIQARMEEVKSQALADAEELGR